jgi:hypothetical protein
MYLVGNSGDVSRDLFYILSNGVFAFRENEIMYSKIQVHVQSIGLHLNSLKLSISIPICTLHYFLGIIIFINFYD